MERGKSKFNSFHLAGIVPVAGQKLDFNFPWHDCMQPLAPNYLAIHHAVMQCAWAGCETIWVVCHNDMQPLIRHQVGEYVYDPVWYGRSYEFRPSEVRKLIPIYYVSVHPNDRDKRDCLGWSVLYGANVAYWTSRQMSKWVTPDKYYASFPYGVYDNRIVREHRKSISSKNGFFLNYHSENVANGLYLGFTFDAEDFKRYRAQLRKDGTGIRGPSMDTVLPIEERWSARNFPLDKVFKSVIIDNDTVQVEVPEYHNIDNWLGYCDYIASPLRAATKRPFNKIIDYHELNPIGIDNEQ